MMISTQPYGRTSAAAIAAVLALSSTQAFAQDVGTSPPPDAPAPAAAEPVATPDPLAPVTSATDTTSTTTTKTTRTTARRATRAPAKPAPVATRTVKRTVTTHAAAPAAVPQAAAAASAPPPPAPVAKPAPVVDLSAKPAAPPPQPAAAEPAFQLNQNELMLGGGALALVALAAAAIAMRRRRRRLEEEEATLYDYVEPLAEPAAPMPQHDPIFDQQRVAAAPVSSAFAWDKSQPCDQPTDDGSDRCPGETWVERAYRGPSPANPSVSLRARLKRAAFFDKREREVEAGQAQPVDTDAGLPEAMDEPLDLKEPA